MEYKRSEVVDACIKHRENGMDYTDIRKTLEKAGIEESEIKIIIRLVDNYDQRTLFKKAEADKGNELIGAGLFLLAVGLFVTFGYSGSKIIVLAYGAIITGISFIGIGASKKRR